MVIPAKIKHEYTRIGYNSVLEKLHIIVGEEFTLEKGDTIILPSKKGAQIEIRRKAPIVPQGFSPYYA